MAKKKLAWDFDKETAEQDAKKSVQKTTHTKPYKKKMGRPSNLEGHDLTRVQITKEARVWLRIMAAKDGQPMNDWLTDLIKREAKKRKLISFL